MKTIPCKDCLTLPACKGRENQNISFCSLLKDWWYRPEGLDNFKEDVQEIKMYLNITDVDTFVMDKAKWK